MMEQISQNNWLIDVICEHTRDGRIIPLRIRIQDEDGVYQVYRIQSYRDITDLANPINGSGSKEILATNHMWCFECKILVFQKERRIRLKYNSYENSWRLGTVYQ